MSLHNISRFLIVTLFCILSGCATPIFHDSLSNPDWEISGKIGVRDGLLKASSSLFQWRQQKDKYAIYLFNNIGQIDLAIIGDSSHAQSQQPDGTIFEAKTPEELLSQLTGWYFPVSPAHFWLQGQTQGTEKNITYSADGKLNSFTQDNWSTTITNYADVEGFSLPHKIKLNQDDLSITLIIKKHAHFTP